MKMLPGIALLLATPAWSAYQYYVTDNLAAIDPGKWTTAGAISTSRAGLSTTDVTGGSLISRVPIPDGSSEAEVSMNAQPGGLRRHLHRLRAGYRRCPHRRHGIGIFPRL